MRVSLLLLPGLDLGSLERGEWPAVAGQLDAERVARLATVAFPARPADLDRRLATELAGGGPLLEAGSPWTHPDGEPREHDLEADLAALAADIPGEGELELIRLPALADAMSCSGIDGALVRELRATLDDALAARLAHSGPDHATWVTGLAAFAPRRQRFPLEGLPVAAAEGPAVELATDARREECLRRAGVERWLEGEGLELFGGGGGRWLLLEPGWSASGGEVVAGHPADPLGRPPALLAVGGAPGRRWPTTIHLSRLAPTLLRALGRPSPEGSDRPLAGH